jgi:hypothetical protein
MVKSRVTFPDGTIVEISKDTSPEQIQAILATLSQSSFPISQSQPSLSDPNQIITAEEVWIYGSKKEKIALFVRNHFGQQEWFTTIDVRDQQLEFVKKMVFGESSAIATYLNRLHDEKLLNKMKRKKISYQLTPKILKEYPPLELDEIGDLLRSVL